MICANPKAWYLLFLLPLLAAGLYYLYLHRLKRMTRFAQQNLINEIALGFTIKRYQWQAVLLLTSCFFMVAALSRPQWGFSERVVKRHGLDIMVVIDVSKSMLTQDVKPSRLERTKLAIKELIMKLNGADHIGLIAFAGDAMLLCPFTYDYNGFLLSLDDLSVHSIPRGGTDMARAIEESIKAYKDMPDSDKAVVLVTDGEEEEGDALIAARRAHEKGIRIFTVGVGSAQGDLIQVPGADGQMEFLKDSKGDVVKSRLNEGLLQQIAYITGGAYVRSGSTQFGLDYLYERQLSKLKKHDNEEKMAKVYNERFQWPLTLALVLLLIETGLGCCGFKGTQKILLILFLLLWPSLSFASTASEVHKANELYKQGKFDDSISYYQKALGLDKDSGVVQYDLGTALYKKGDYAKALGYLQGVAEDKSLKINPQAAYNLGNVLYKSGLQKASSDVDEAIKSLQEALKAYGQAIRGNPKDEDAHYNQDFVKKEIERLKKIQKEQQKKQEGDHQKNKEKQDEQKNQGQGKEQKEKESQQQQGKEQKKQQSQEEQPQEQKDKKDQKQQSLKAQKTKGAKDKNKESQAQQSPKDIEQKEAQEMLEEYRDNEEPKKILNFTPQKSDQKPVLKDW
ncbi:MAG: VWA domain-containing protein [Candidatus Omnitrophica bacterium]|nr:VWA domain-containing protein [Candidatus Omnitrophota bacterium]